MGAPTDIVRDRFLEERAFLSFEFYWPGNEFPSKYKLPFFENPQMTEAGSANYHKYDPIGRSSSLFTYINSPARKLNLEFTITPDHILEYGKMVTPDRYILTTLVDNQEKGKNSILRKGDVAPVGGGGHTAEHRLLSQTIDKGIGEFRKLATQGGKQGVRKKHKALDSQRPLSKNELDFLFYGQEWADNLSYDQLRAGVKGARHAAIKEYAVEDEYTQYPKEARQALATILFWINLIRSSVKNNNNNTSYGPPILRLTFGPMYNAVPFICENYSIKGLDARGFDLQTLFHRGFDISMKLNEIRVGDFKTFKPGENNEKVNRDGVAGWEAIFEHGTFDPYDLGG